MGCDIHLVVQLRENGEWVDVTTDTWSMLDGEVRDYVDFWEPRCYWTFGALAGVRHDGWPPISDQRGLPDDFEHDDYLHHVGAPLEDFDGLKDMGDHNHGWCTLAELIAFDTEWTWDEDYRNYTMLLHWIPELKKLGQPDDVRLVFGFDS